MRSGESIPPLYKSAESAPPSYRDERFIEGLFDDVYFAELYELACTVLLRGDPVSIPLHEQSAEERVVQMLGVRGLRHALEILDGVREYTSGALDKGLDDHGDPISGPPINPLCRPDFFNTSVEREKIVKIEGLGLRLIEEAFGVLGTEGIRQVQKFKNATTDQEQLAVLHWLDTTLTKMAYGGRGLNQDLDIADASYHPIRFSPKAIGVYPNHRVAPTCLGIALIAAGFFEQTGQSYMHAGVMETGPQGQMLAAKHLARKGVDEICSHLGVTVPDSIRERLDKKQDELFRAYSEDRGTHTAILVQLQSGYWFQFDPNFQASVLPPLIAVSPNPNADEIDVTDPTQSVLDVSIQSAYDTLVEFQDIAPGLELGKYFFKPYTADAWVWFMKHLKTPEYTSERLEAMLSDLDAESTLETIRQFVVDEWLLQDSENNIVTQMQKERLMQTQLPDSCGNNELLINKVFYDAANAFLLWDMPIETWRSRCTYDRNFRKNRVEDILRLPALMGLSFGLILAKSRDSRRTLHSKMELGLPHLSLGLSALNNIALYLDDKLSINAWLSLWSSDTPMFDRTPSGGTASTAQEAAVVNNFAVMLYGLCYARSHGIVTRFMEEWLQNEPQTEEQ